MARSNKYASLNFNDIYEKKIIDKQNPNPKSSSSSPKTIISNSRIHGNMLVLTRPTPKPIPIPIPLPASPQPDPIYLRTTGSAPSVSPTIPSLVVRSPKTDKFVPPHLRPGFCCKEEKPVGPARFEGRPNSGGGASGYERVRRGAGGFGFVETNRPGSSGSRPNSSG